MIVDQTTVGDEDDESKVLIVNEEQEIKVKDQAEEEEEEEAPKVIHYPSLISVMAIGFIANVEYGIVMPSIWSYIQSLGGTNDILGWAVSSFSISQVIFLPLIGYWADKRTIRESFCISLIIGILGNIVYAMSINPYMIILGRFMAGMGSSNMALTNSYVSYTSTKAQRTAYMAKINGINAFGLVAGPAFNLALSKLNFGCHLFDKVNLIVDPLRAPGWLLSILLSFCLASFVFWKEPENKDSDDEKPKQSERTPLLSNQPSIKYQQYQQNNEQKKNNLKIFVNSPEQVEFLNNSLQNAQLQREIEEQQFLSSNISPSGTPKSTIQPQHNVKGSSNDLIGESLNNNLSLSHISSCYLSYNYSQSSKIYKKSHIYSKDILSINAESPQSKGRLRALIGGIKSLLQASLLTCFVINFVQNLIFGALETLITPITSVQYNFDSIENSIMYSLISVIIIILIIITVVISGKVQDKYIILFGQLCLGAGLILLCIFFGGPASRHVALWKFALAVAVTVCGIPTQNTSVYSLYSKLLNRIFGDNAKQGLQTGVMMLVGSFARIIGPLSSYGLELTNRFPLFIIFVSLWVFDICITLIFYKSLTFKSNGKSSSVVVSH